MILKIVAIDHNPTELTLTKIPTAIRLMEINFLLGKEKTTVAALHNFFFVFHLPSFNLYNF